MNVLMFPFILAIPALILVIARPNQPRWQHLSLIFLIWTPLIMLLLTGLTHLSGPARYDMYFAVIDARLGQPSYMLGRLVWMHPLLHAVLYQYYLWSLVAPMLVVAAPIVISDIRIGYRSFVAFLISPVLAAIAYAFVPASGPVYAFVGYPFQKLDLSNLHILMLNARPNCMPSVHMSIALMTMLFLWRWKSGRVIGIANALMTVFATLGLGEHYVIDLIASVPYTIAIVWIVNMVFKVRSVKKLYLVPAPSCSRFTT